jgi:hypothetical protein
VIDLQLNELEPFMEAVSPVGILLCIDAGVELQPEIIRRVMKWKG